MATVAATFLVVVCATAKAFVLTIDIARQRPLGIEQGEHPDDGPDAAGEIERCHHYTGDPTPVEGKAMLH